MDDFRTNYPWMLHSPKYEELEADTSVAIFYAAFIAFVPSEVKSPWYGTVTTSSSTMLDGNYVTRLSFFALKHTADLHMWEHVEPTPYVPYYHSPQSPPDVVHREIYTVDEHGNWTPASPTHWRYGPPMGDISGIVPVNDLAKILYAELSLA